MRLTGEVVSWRDNTGYGWVKPDEGGPDLFLHCTAIPDRDWPKIGDRVSYREKDGGKGPMAIAVRIIG